MREDYRLTIVLLGMLLVMRITAVDAQSGRWDGAADVPVEPLACPGDVDSDRQTTASAYDGGQPINTPGLAGQNILLVNILADNSSDYDDFVQEGMLEAASSLRNVQFVNNLPAVGSSSDQLNLLNGTASSEIAGVLLDVIDPSVTSPAQRQLLQAGKHVVTYGSDSQPDTREWFVQPVRPNALAKAIVERFVQEAGESAAFAIMTTRYDDPLTSHWIAEIWAYAQECHPNIEWLETVEAQDDEVLAYNLIATLLNQYDDDLNGILSLTPFGTPNAAEAVKSAGLCGDVSVVGLGMPSRMKSYIDEGCAGSAILWNPLDLGYATVYAMRRAIDGDLRPGSTSLDAGRLGELRVVGSEILLGTPVVADARNIDNFDF